MSRLVRATAALAMLLFLCSAAHAQLIVRTLTLSSEFVNAPGTPRVVWNSAQKLWLAVWRENSVPPAIKARLIQTNGTARPVKVLAPFPSNAVHSFDIACDPVNNRYLLAYESSQGVMTQLFSSGLVRIGAPNIIEPASVQTVPRLLYDPEDGDFVVYWLGTQDGFARKALTSRNVDAQGRPQSPKRQLRTASGSHEFLSVAANTHERNSMAVLLDTNGAGATVTGINLKADGTAGPVRILQPFTNGLRSYGTLGFSPVSGSGLAFWTDGGFVKFRRINRNGTLAGSTAQLSSAADSYSIQPAILYDPSVNLFQGSWSLGNQIRAMLIHPVTGAIVRQPSTIARSILLNCGNVSNSNDPATGNTIVVWDDFTVGSPTRFLVRGVVLNNRP